MVYVVELDVGLVGTTVYSVVYDINKSRWRRFFHVRKASILEANIGVGIQRKFSKGKSLNGYTESFIREYGDSATFSGAGSLPMSGTIKTFVKENYLLVGDAAGMVLPSNGAGITIAMIGGRIAGNVIHEHLEYGVPLKEYEKRWKKQMGQVMKNSKRSFKLGSLLLRFPDWFINLTFFGCKSK